MKFATVKDDIENVTSWPASQAAWDAGEETRYIQIITDGTIPGVKISDLAFVYAYQNGTWVPCSWDDYDQVSAVTESLPFSAEKFKVSFTNGFEWILNKES